jgi:tripartite-type tricarboxylate transporter receptor subunit TctC
MIVASSAGASIDIVTRTMQQGFGRAMGSSVIVENIAGAGGVLGMQTLARAAPDGSTLVINTNNALISPALMKTPPYDLDKDFTTIAMIGLVPLVVVVNAAKVPARDPTEFVAYLRANASKVNYGTSGIGSSLHLAIGTIQNELGIEMTHIPYKGVAPMINGTLAGEVDFMALSLGTVEGHVASGALRTIGFLTNQRVPNWPSIPTFAEHGFQKFGSEVWIAAFGPKGMSPALVSKVRGALIAALSDPSIQPALEKVGNVIKVSSTEEAQAIVRQDMRKYAELVKKIKLSAD